MIEAVAMLAGFAAPAPAVAPCPPAEVAGWVVTIRSADRTPSRGTAPFVTTPTGARTVLHAADVLCDGDVVRNPSGSALVVKIRIAGKVSELRPGAPPFKIVRPGWLERVTESAQHLFDTVRRYNRSTRSLSPTGVRGAHPLGCTTSPMAADGATNFVTSEVRLRLAWNCPQAGTRYSVTVVTPEATHKLFTDRPQFSLNAKKICPLGCTVSVAPLDSPSSNILHAPIRILQPSEVPRDIASLPEGGGGAELIEKGPGWRLMGASLLWERGCKVPAAALAARDLYNLKNPEAVCADAPRTSVRARPIKR